MDVSKAVLVGFAMVALAIAAVGTSARVGAQSAMGGYQISSGSAGSAWGIAPNGDVLYCTIGAAGGPGCLKARMQ